MSIKEIEMFAKQHSGFKEEACEERTDEDDDVHEERENPKGRIKEVKGSPSQKKRKSAGAQRKLAIPNSGRCLKNSKPDCQYASISSLYDTKILESIKFHQSPPGNDASILATNFKKAKIGEVPEFDHRGEYTNQMETQTG